MPTIDATRASVLLVDDHACPGVAFAQAPHDLDTLHDRHPQIQQRHVRAMALERLDGLDAVAGFGDDVQVGFLVDDVGHAGSEQGVIIDQEHAGPRCWRHGLS